MSIFLDRAQHPHYLMQNSLCSSHVGAYVPYVRTNKPGFSIRCSCFVHECQRESRLAPERHVPQSLAVIRSLDSPSSGVNKTNAYHASFSHLMPHHRAAAISLRCTTSKPDISHHQPPHEASFRRHDWPATLLAYPAIMAINSFLLPVGDGLRLAHAQNPSSISLVDITPNIVKP